MTTFEETGKEKHTKIAIKKPYVYEKCLKFNDKLKRGESIAIIQFQYSYLCNMACKHCSIKRFQNRPDQERFTPEKTKELAKQADELGLARFVITGGEPLVFPDLDEVVEAINPDKFYINMDTNGFLLDKEKARHLLSIGIDRVQLSIDSLIPEEHDKLRNRKGAYDKAMKAFEACKETGLDVFIQTVVTKQRLYDTEFLQFVKFFNERDTTVFVNYAKPVGSWEGKYDTMINMEDINYTKELEKTYNLCTHLTPAYGRDLGCIAVKGMVSVTEFGDVQPCPYIHTSIGNVFKEPLKDILQRGLDIKYFGEWAETCWIAENMPFIKEHIEPHVYGNKLPVSCAKMFSEKDKTKTIFNQYMLEKGLFDDQA